MDPHAAATAKRDIDMTNLSASQDTEDERERTSLEGQLKDDTAVHGDLQERTVAEDDEEGADEDDDDDDDDDEEDEEDEMDSEEDQVARSDSASMLRMMQSLPENEARRHEQFRRSHFERGVMKRVRGEVEAEGLELFRELTALVL